jgi:hypothetical protein
MNYDSIFFINSCINVQRGGLSIYTPEERFEQTIGSIESVQKLAPNSKIYLFDSSVESVPIIQQKTIEDKSVIFHYTGEDDTMKQMTMRGLKNFAETYSFILFFRWLKLTNSLVTANRIYKLSGRYQLNENFDYNLRPENSFVFKKSVKSWMSEEQCKFTGVDRVYDTRLWHMDFKLIDTFYDSLMYIFNDSYTLGIDVEHSFYKHLHKYNVTEVDVIGVQGNKAPNGEYVNE